MDEHKALIEDFARGIDEMRYTSVAFTGKNFVVFKVAGHMRWDGRWMPQVWEPVKHFMIRKGVWWMSREGAIKKWEGRVSKDVLKQALQDDEDKELASHAREVRKLPVSRGRRPRTAK